MKKKLVVMAMLLFAICFAGFAQGAFSAEPSQYVAKAEEEKKEYTIVVRGKILEKAGGSKTITKEETFVLIDTSLSSARSRAKRAFRDLYGRLVVETIIMSEKINESCQIQVF